MTLPQDPSHQTFHFGHSRPETRRVLSSQATGLPNPGGEKKQITRNRASYSCKTCRKRKIKCDKVHPACGNCTKNHERCVFSAASRSSSALPDASPEAVRHNAKRRKAAGDERESPFEESSSSSENTGGNGQVNPAIEDRLDRLTALVEALSRGKAEEAAAHLDSGVGLRQENVAGRRKTSFATSRHNGDGSLRPEGTTERRPNGESQPRNGSSDPASKPSSYEFDLPTDSIELEDPLSRLNLGYLSVQEGGRSRYVGSTWWAFVSDELDQLNILLKDQNRYLSASSIGNRQCDQREESNEQIECPASEASHDSCLPNSFHTSGDHQHHQKSQFREDCPACRSHATDKFMLLQSLDSHPSRFVRMDSDMVAGVPEESASHLLFRCWISGVHCYCAVMYPPIVLEKYNLFWDWYKNGRATGMPHPCPSFMPFFYAIWYAGSVSLSLKGLRRWFPGTTRAALSAKLHDQAAKCLTLTSFPRNASLPQLAALLMLQIIPAKEEEPFTISIFVSLAIRVAQTLGLHREPSLFNMEPWMAEGRRRIFWQIFQLDVYVAVTSGLPPMLSDDFFDTRMISEVKDTMLGTKEAEEYETATARGERPLDNPDNPSTRKWDSMVSVQYLVAKARYTTAHAVSKILRIHLGTNPITREDMFEMRKILAAVDHQLNETIRRIPTKGIPELGFVPDIDEKGRSLIGDYDPANAKPPTEEDIRPFIGMTPHEGLDEHIVRYHWNTLIAFHKFSRIVLSLLIDKMYCVAFLPLLKNAKSKFWSCARQCALRSCHGYMRKFLALATDPAFQPFQWSWPGMHQPMHASMIMLVDLYERPFSVEAPRSRAFIDKIFSMSGPDGGIVSGEDGVANMRPLREGGREAWELLRKLREKAWERAGLDPDILWTEESQINAGVAQPLTEVQRMAQSLREDLIHVDADTPPNGHDIPRASSSAAGVQQVVNSAVNDIQSANDGGAAQASRDTGIRPAPPERQTVYAGGGHLPNVYKGVVEPLLNSSRQAPAPPQPLAPPPAPSYFDPPTAASSNADDPAATITRTTTSGPKETAAPSPTVEHEHHDEDFWNRWDSVLGTHAGFEDLMEDIRWDDLGTRDEMNLM